MGRFKEEYKFLNDVFSNEKNFDSAEWLEIIAETYAVAQEKKVPVYEVARRRFRNKEFYIHTCIMMGISPAKYYRLLRIFFKLAERNIEKVFATSKK